MKAGVDYVGITTPFCCNDGKGNFLLHKRSKNCRDEQGMWDMDSGQLEFGLTLEENVLKEVLEEYGVKGKIQKSLPSHSIFREHNGTKTHWLAIPFFILVEREKVKIGDPEKMDEIGWFKLDNLPKPLHKGFSHTLKNYNEYFEEYR
jgi:8-oxo-dGTP diphosphatase